MATWVAGEGSGAMSDRVRTFSLVTLITALIWLVAESESLRTETLTFDVTVQSSGNKAVRLSPDQAWNRRVEVTVRGPTSAIDQLRQTVSPGVRLAPGEGLPLDAGPTTVVLREALRETEAFAGSGITPVECTPATVRMEVADLVEHSMEVRGVLDAEVEGVVRVSPAQVTLRVPQEVANELDGSATLIARAPRSVVNGAPPGVEQQVEGVPVELPAEMAGAWGISGPLPRVTVTFTLRETVSSVTLPQVPVQIGLAPIELPRWEVSVADQFIRDVTVTGPRDVISRLQGNGDQPPPLRVVALVWLSFEDLERGIETKEAEFVALPRPREAISFEAASPIVSLRIQRRSGEAGGARPLDGLGGDTP